MNSLRKLAATVSMALPAMLMVTNASAADDIQFVLPDTQNYSVLYGDFYSYSAPILDHWFPTGNGSTAGGAPMQFSSTLTGNGGPAGVITVDHQLNVFSYSGGQETTNQPTGAEQGYTQGSNPYFTTITTTGTNMSASDPANGSTQLADNKNTWDVNLATLNAMLTADGVKGGVATMVFNNNEGNAQANQELSVWMQWIVWSSKGGVDPIVFTLANSCISGGGNVCLSGGVLGNKGGYVEGPGKDPTLYSAALSSNFYPDLYPGQIPNGGVTGVPQPTDFVTSGGSVCMHADGTLFNCADGATPAETYNHNLGADRMSYIVFSQEFNTFLAAWRNGQYADYDMFSVDLRTGCFTETSLKPNGEPKAAECTADPVTGLYPTNGGNERAFLARAVFAETVPEPAPLLLIAVGLLAMGATTRRRKV